ncbi:MAG: ATPase, T2SS/T4P/T4SS family [Planctomycetota bacterium]
METVEIEIQDARTGARRVVRTRQTTLVAGRDPDNDLVLVSPFVSRRHLRLHLDADGAAVENMSFNTCSVAGREVAHGESLAVAAHDEIRVAEFSLRVVRTGSPAPATRGLAEVRFTTLSGLHRELVQRLQGHAELLRDPQSQVARARVADKLDAILEPWLHQADGAALSELAAAALREYALLGPGTPSAAAGDRHADVGPFACELAALVDHLAKRLATDRDGLGNRLMHVDPECANVLRAVTAHADRALHVHLVRSDLRREIDALVFGLGPLEALLRRPDVVEIMVVGYDRVYVERDGRLQLTGLRFLSDENLIDVLQRIVAPLGRRIDRSSPMVDGRLPSGARVNAMIGPVAVQGPQLTIRKFPAQPLTIDDLIERGALDGRAAAFLRGCVRARKNLLVSGGTGSGKTTLLNALAAFIPGCERVVTIEDAAELRLQQEHVVALETRPPNMEGRGEISIRDLVRNSLRMRPDRIVVGECRGAEAADMLQAMNTGHGGAMTTIHANGAADAIRRLEVMVLTACDIPLRAVREQVASAIDIVVQVRRARDGTRCITQIAEVAGFDPEHAEVLVVDLYARHTGSGKLESTGRLASFASELVARGDIDAAELFA